MNRSSQNPDPQMISQQDRERDLQIDSALQALNSVQPAARFEQRVHARLAQAQEVAAAGTTWSNSLQKVAAVFAGLFSWPRAAFALATFTAGVFAATLGLPLLHRAPAEPVTSHMLTTPAAAPANSTGTVAAQPADVHPGFTVRTPDGRAAALNTQGTVATVRSRNAHSDTQFAARQTDHVHARLTRPARPKAGQPATTSADQPAATTQDASPATAPADRDAQQ
jgi:hypothetical protein